MVMTDFGKISLLSQVEKSNFPQFICGRILPVKDDILTAPITGKKCVYYQIVVEELLDRTDENGMAASQSEKGKVWVGQIYETKSADFTIIDPSSPSLSLYIPGGTISVKANITEDDLNAHERGLCKQFKPNEQLPSHLMVRYSNTSNLAGSLSAVACA